MSEETNKPEVTNAPEDAGSEDVGQESVGPTDPMKAISDAVGRDFKSVDDFKNHYENLNKLVGDQTVASQRKAADKYEQVKSKLAKDMPSSFNDPDEYVDFLLTQDQVPQTNAVDPTEWRNNKKASQEASQRDSQLDELFEFKQKTELTREFPEADKYFDLISSVAKAKGEKNLAKIVKETPEIMGLVEADRDRAATSVIEDNKRVAPQNQRRVDSLIKRISDNPSDGDAREALVEEYTKRNKI